MKIHTCNNCKNEGINYHKIKYYSLIAITRDDVNFYYLCDECWENELYVLEE